jgi:sulfur carrier protein
VKCIINDRKKTIKKIKFRGKISQLLSKLGINPEVMIIKRNGVIVTELDTVKNNDELELIKVIYGG